MRTMSVASWWWKVGVALVSAGVVVLGVAPARAASADEARLLALHNQVRAANGLAPLKVNGQITYVAQRWATTVAERGVISHNGSLPSQVTGWKDLGENVGVGGTADAVHDGFMASPTHRANIVDPAFTEVGFGVVRPDARIFVVVVFMQPASSAAAAPVVTAPAAKAINAPVATPAPRAPSTVTAAAPSLPSVPSIPAAAPAAPTPGELSPWMIVSLEQVRSMPATSR